MSGGAPSRLPAVKTFDRWSKVSDGPHCESDAVERITQVEPRLRVVVGKDAIRLKLDDDRSQPAKFGS